MLEIVRFEAKESKVGKECRCLLFLYKILDSVEDERNTKVWSLGSYHKLGIFSCKFGCQFEVVLSVL